MGNLHNKEPLPGKETASLSQSIPTSQPSSQVKNYTQKELALLKTVSNRVRNFVVPVPGWLMDYYHTNHETLPSATFRTLTTLMKMCGWFNGICDVQLRALALYLNLSERQVNNHLNALKQLGVTRHQLRIAIRIRLPEELTPTLILKQLQDKKLTTAKPRQGKSVSSAQQSNSASQQPVSLNPETDFEEVRNEVPGPVQIGDVLNSYGKRERNQGQ